MIDTMPPPGRPATDAPAASGIQLLTILLIFAAGFGLGAAAYLLAHVDWLAGIQASLSGTEPKVFWYVSRATGFVAFGLLWLAIVLGLSITNKLARLWPGGPAAADLHQYTSLLGLAFGCFHGLILTLDGYSNYTLAQVLVPFTSTQYRPVWVGLGQFGLYLGAVVALSFYVRRFIGYRAWRLIHFASFAFFVLVLLHGLFSGTDSAALWARSLYLGSALSVLGLTFHRIRVARQAPAHGARATAPVRTSHVPPNGAS